jgi:DNA-binding SARP family transcriptional activator
LTAAPLFIQTLGPFRAWRRGQEIGRGAWPREKALHLFQLLVCHRGHGVHRDRILEMLWPDSSASTAATGLRVALSAVRNALEPDRESGTDGGFVRRDGDTIRLAMESGIRVDVDDFTRLLKTARAAESGDRDAMIVAYETALATYRGDFLEENPYAAWAEEERQQRRSEFLTAAERFATLLLRAGDAERAARWAEAMLHHDPLWESAYALLMEAHWQQGNRALAVRAYNRCKKRLRDGLGVPPSARITALLDRIARPESGPAASSR